jgi:hypothetical protein
MQLNNSIPINFGFEVNNALLSSVDQLSYKAQLNGFNAANCKEMIDDIQNAADKSSLHAVGKAFTLTMPEALLFSVCVNLWVEKQSLSREVLSESLQLKGMAWLKLQPLLLELQYKGLLQFKKVADRGKGPAKSWQYTVPHEVLKFIQLDGKKFVQPKLKVESEWDFLQQVFALLEGRQAQPEARAYYEQKVGALLEVAREKEKVPFVKTMRQRGFARGLVLMCCYLQYVQRVGRRTALDIYSAANIAYQRESAKQQFIADLQSGQHRLVQAGLITVTEDEERRVPVVHFFPEAAAFKSSKQEAKNSPPSQFEALKLYVPSTEGRQKLVYDEATTSILQSVEDALRADKYVQLKERLKVAGLPAGMTVLLQGAPGVGKTAWATQLAAISNRPLYEVDIATIKSPWLGDMEKMIRKVFEEYRDVQSQLQLDPILLFNEADSLLVRRQAAIGHNATIQHMTNTCTNIFLEELERFEGILIATTNVAVMLDEAFERRFLYRVELKAPDATSRQRIWNQKFTELPAAWIQTLAALQLTGAQIDNVRRKYISFQVLQDASPEFEMLLNWTKDEAKSVFNRPKAGYVL